MISEYGRDLLKADQKVDPDLPPRTSTNYVKNALNNKHEYAGGG